MALSSGFDRSMPTQGVAQSSGAIDKCVNVQLMPFLAVPFVGVILILAPAQAPGLLVILPVLLAYARRSSWSARRIELWTTSSRVGDIAA
ncbi:hypothetical protein [Streptomyces sp. IGB124]|uniref:hypothetical protein n=1 Tax=Streptomyces sp. IGB124 TaxID=1519485 RepID=UPI000AAEEA04|nr:hypothetical protein [Streptomyces sp. IGB124]